MDWRPSTAVDRRLSTVDRTSAVRSIGLVLVLAGAIACGGSGGIGAVACSVEVPSASAAPQGIALDSSGGKASIVVSGVPSDDLAALGRAAMTREQWAGIMRVSVGEGQPAVVGAYEIDGDRVRFTPMFPLDPGRQYQVVFASAGARIEGWVGLPPSTAVPTTVVSHVYPSSEVVPENQLRMYLHFSAPMGIRGGLDYVRLLDDKGQTVEDPFLPLDTEFWNDDRTRYTVFFDPGRQKRGIMPNQLMGRALEPGRRYTLVVDREWRDGNGLPLKESFSRTFRVGPADERPLDTASWRIAPPPAGSRDPLVVTFPEALDHGLLLRAVGVARDGRALPGAIAIEPGETVWRFTPERAWDAGGYQLVVLGVLEDLAGNRIGRAFEVDNFDRADRSPEPERTEIVFRVSAGGR